MKFYIHPIAVHYPIAFYFLELVLILIWIGKNDRVYLQFAKFAFKLGYLCMFLAAAAGLFDVGGFNHVTGEVRVHFIAAMSVVVFYTIRALFWKFGKLEQPHYRLTQFLFAISGNILVAITGYFGGRLVYAT